MAEKKNAQGPEDPAVTAAPDPEELVEYTRPVDLTGRTMDLVVGVNGEFIRIRNGETVRIRRKFLEVIRNAEAQRMAALDTMNRAAKASRRAMADL